MDYIVILFYKYISISDPEKLKQEQKNLCQKLGLKGRVIIASEGINATLEGTSENIETYLDTISGNLLFEGIHIKKSQGTGSAFPKLSVKVRSEIVAARLGKDDINPNYITGKYIQPEELHKWFEEKKEFYIVDMRNGFEQNSGYFDKSILSGFENFDDLPGILPKLASLKNKVVVTVCTGGVRCEKASGFLVKHGFKDVYQLYGGMHAYMEQYPTGFFKGVLYTFDNRLVMGFNQDPNREVVGRCANCSKPSENYINCTDGFCHRHFIACLDCLKGQKSMLCPMGCRDYSKEHPETLN